MAHGETHSARTNREVYFLPEIRCQPGAETRLAR